MPSRKSVGPITSGRPAAKLRRLDTIAAIAEERTHRPAEVVFRVLGSDEDGLRLERVGRWQRWAAPAMRSRPRANKDRMDHLVAAMSALDPADRTVWDGDQPDCRALSERLGWPVEIEDRDRAWRQVAGECEKEAA